MKNIFYVYIHINPSNNHVFYVGKGHNNRAFEKTGRNKYWKAIVNKYGFEVELIEENLIEKVALEREIYWIAQFKVWGFRLANMTEGGQGVCGYEGFWKGKNHPRGIVSEQTRKNISAVAKLRTGSKTNSYGKRIINKNEKIKRVSKDELHLYLLDSWQLGIPKFVKDKVSLKNKGNIPHNKGKTLEQIYTPDKAKELREVARKAAIGHIPWNKGIKGVSKGGRKALPIIIKNCKQCNSEFKVRYGKRNRIYCSQNCSNKNNPKKSY